MRPTTLSRLAPMLALFLLLPGTASAAAESPALQALVAAAKKESALTLQWGEGTFGGSAGAPLFEKGLNAMFGTNIHITFTPGASMPQVGNEIAMRQAAGQPSPTDVYVGYADVLSRLAPRKPFTRHDWAKLLPGRITPNIVDENGTLLKVVTALPGIAYNAQLAPDKPKLLTDLLKPEWKGKIAATPYAANYDVLAANDMWGPARAIDFARKISAQVSGLMRCNEGERLATGEFLAFAITCSGTDFFDIIRKGAPVVQVPPDDFPVLGYFYIGVPKNAPHPNAGALYAVFCMTEAGQKLIHQTWDTDLDLFPETTMHKRVAELEHARGRKFEVIDVGWYAKHPEAYTAWKQIIKIFTANK
ncbi:MAG: ABC transporter substrate-binding protein [Stellaceae bacterium]